MNEYRRHTSAVLKQTIGPLRLMREGGWGGNGWGDWSEWYALWRDESGRDLIVGHWSNDYRDCYVGSDTGAYRFAQWRKRIRSLALAFDGKGIRDGAELRDLVYANDLRRDLGYTTTTFASAQQ